MIDRTMQRITSVLVSVKIFIEPKSEEQTSPAILDDVGKRFIRR